MKKKQKVDLTIAILLIVVGVVLMLLPNFKILDLENQLLNFKILLNDTLKDPEASKRLLESKSKISSLLLKGKEFPDTSCLNYVSSRPRDISLEPSPKNEPIINQIIVSFNISNISLYFLFLYL